MGMPLMIVAAMVAMSAGIFGFVGHMDPFWMAVVTIVAISVFGGVLRELVKSRKDLSNTAQRNLSEINERMARIEADIADIKEQIADFIIKQV